MDDAESGATIRRHLMDFFAGHASEEHVWHLGRLEETPRLRVIEFAPGPKSGLWVYSTIGAWEVHPDPQLEFVIVAPAKDLRHVELLFMVAWYHGRYGLGTGHTMPIGEPWLPGSECDSFLVSLPYPFGPDLEICNFEGSHLHVLWLLPITAREREFKVKEGLEALEQRFDAEGLEYWDSTRKSVL